MASKKTTKSVRVDQLLAQRIEAYAGSRCVKESEAIRDLIEKGLACEGLSVFATPVGSLIRDVIEAEFSLMREEMDERNERLEDRVARVCSRGTRASLQAAAQLNDAARAVIPQWRDVGAEELWRYYSRMGGELQGGTDYADARGRR